MGKILQQGNLDGMCLLYSILNAYKVLTGDNNTSHGFAKSISEPWSKIVDSLPWSQNFLNGAGTNFSTHLNVSENVIMEEALIRKTISILNRGKSKKIIFSKVCLPVNADQFDAIISDNVSAESALIFVVSKFKSTSVGEKICEDFNHWLCAVDFNTSRVFMACSFAPHLGATEKISSRLKRDYNNTMNRSDFNSNNIERSSLYKLSL